MQKWCIVFLIFIVFYSSTSVGEENESKEKICMGIELGTWKPNNLRSTDTPFTFSLSKKYVYIGASLITPLARNLSVRVAAGYFNYNNNSHQKSVALIPILCDIKYVLISDSPISPFVSYGAGIYIGDKSLSEISSFEFNKNNIGYGLNLGTGFDFFISHHWLVGIEFRYHYLKFSKVLIFTDDYSGPKINLALYYRF